MSLSLHGGLYLETLELAGLPPAAKERRLTALVIATDVLVWKLLRLDMQLSRPQATKIVLEMIESYTRQSN